MSMAKLTKADVLHVAKLAKLKLTEKEVEKFLSQLSSIVDYISELSEVDTKGVEPTSQTTGLINVLRDDKANPNQTLSAQKAVSGTDKVHNNLFVVDAILKERSDK